MPIWLWMVDGLYGRQIKGFSMKIGEREVGPANRPLVIVELGINHEGSLDTAFSMVDAAFESGAEIIKHQTHVVADEMSSEARSVIPGNSDKSIYEIMNRCALTEEEELQLKKYVEGKGMLFISTPFSRAAADRLERMDVPAYKIGSGECNNYPLLKHIVGFGKPVILSTGMNDIRSIEKSVNIIERAGLPYALLHTTNIYPTPHHLVRLNALQEIKKAFPNALIGLSDHTTSNYACFGAVALGASIVERHFTDHMDRPGPDIICSMDKSQLRTLIEGVNIIHAELGAGKGPVEEEKVTIDFAFASVVSTQYIPKGTELTTQNTWVKRPGTGEFLAEKYEELLGRRAAQDIEPDVQLKSEYISFDCTN